MNVTPKTASIILCGCLLVNLAFKSSAAETAEKPGASINPRQAQSALGTGATSTFENIFRQALLEEELNQDLGAAIRAYRDVIAGLDANRKMAATAILRLGECYRKLGQTNEAVLQFERIQRDFSEQAQLVELAQRRLFELTPKRALASTGGAATSKPLNPVQAQLVGEELKLLEIQLVSVERQMSSGKALLSDRIKLQQEMLSLRRQLPENAQPTKQQSLIGQQIKLVETLLDETKKKISVGAAAPVDAIPFERDILALKREMAAAVVMASVAGGSSAPDAITDEEAKEVQRIRAIIKDSPDLINALDTEGFTPLHVAAGKGQMMVAQFLLDNHAEVNAKDKLGATPLYRAASQGHKSVVQLLLAHGANINAADNRGETPLYSAALRGYVAVVEILLTNKAEVNSKGIRYNNYITDFTPLHAAVTEGVSTSWRAVTLKGFEAIAEQLIAHGADVNAVCRVSGDQDDGTPLHFAVMNGSSNVVKVLLAHGAQVNVRNGPGNSPLLLAARTGRWEIAGLLLDHRAEVNAQTKNGLSPLRFAVQQGQLAPAKMLLEHQTNPNLSDLGGFTPLHEAVKLGNKALAELLLNNKANPNAMDRNGQTPLTIGANNPTSTDLVELLLARGANMDAQQPADAGARTSLHVAIRAAATNNVQVILARKPNLSLRDRDGLTPLQTAVGQHNTAVTKLLLDANADPNVTWQDGNTPLHWAVRDGSKEIATLLLEHKANVNAQNNAGLTPLRMVVRQNPPPLPMPGVPGLPVRAVRTPGSPDSAQPTPASPAEMADLLRQYGASENPYRLSQIAICRPALQIFDPIFFKGTNVYDRFTLLELLTIRDYPFPDLANITIHRLTPTGETNDISVNVLFTLYSDNPAKDIWLNWGDVVELPIKDHLVDEKWTLLPASTRDQLRKYLQRKVEFVIKGQTNQAIMLPGILSQNSYRGRAGEFDISKYGYLTHHDRLDFKSLTWTTVGINRSSAGFSVRDSITKDQIDGTVVWLTDNPNLTRVKVTWTNVNTKEAGAEIVTILNALRLNDAVRNANILLTSSDLTRVKVKRIDPVIKERLEMVFNLEKTDPKTDLWLRDGDVIEIPERADSGEATTEGMQPK